MENYVMCDVMHVHILKFIARDDLSEIKLVIEDYSRLQDPFEFNIMPSRASKFNDFSWNMKKNMHYQSCLSDLQDLGGVRQYHQYYIQNQTLSNIKFVSLCSLQGKKSFR